MTLPEDGSASPAGPPEARRQVTRRRLLQGAGIGALAAAGAGVAASGGPARAASAAAPPLHVLTQDEEGELNAWCDVVVTGAATTALPGSAERGVARFVDHQLAARPADVLLTLRSDTTVPPPYVDFYRSGLKALRELSKAKGAAAFSRLSPRVQHDLVASFADAAPAPAGWTGPPLWYFATRADAVDVVFGTPAAFVELGFPYLPHITPPPTLWVTAQERV